MYGDCDEATAQSAMNHLRPQATGGYVQPCSVSELLAVSCTSIICSDDLCLRPRWATRIARDRLGAHVIELPGSHSPFLSRPSALAEVLLRIADEN